MKLLFVSNYFWPDTAGGYDLYCKDLVEWFNARGHQVSVLTSLGNEARYPYRVERRLSLVKEWTSWAVHRTRIRNSLVLKQHLQAHPADLVVFSDPRFVAGYDMLAQIMGRVPTALIVGDPGIFQTVPASRRSWHRIVNGLLPRMAGLQPFQLPCVDVAIANSRYTLARCESSGVARSCVCIYNGIPAPSGTAPEPPPIPAEPQLLFVGRVVEQKGLHIALEALSILKTRDGLTPRLTLIGARDSEYLTHLKTLAAEQGLSPQLDIRGWVARGELDALYAQFSIFVHPHIASEAFGLTNVEAMRQGLVVITSDLGGPAEIVVHGRNGFLIPPGDATALADCIKALLQDRPLMARLRERALRTVREELDFEKKSREYETLFTSLV